MQIPGLLLCRSCLSCYARSVFGPCLCTARRCAQFPSQRPLLHTERVETLRHGGFLEAFREVDAPGVAANPHELVECQVLVERQLGHAPCPQLGQDASDLCG